MLTRKILWMFWFNYFLRQFSSWIKYFDIIYIMENIVFVSRCFDLYRFFVYYDRIFIKNHKHTTIYTIFDNGRMVITIISLRISI